MELKTRIQWKVIGLMMKHLLVVLPATTSSDKHYKLSLKYRDKLQTMIGGPEFYQGNKPVITLKELDFPFVKL